MNLASPLFFFKHMPINMICQGVFLGRGLPILLSRNQRVWPPVEVKAFSMRAAPAWANQSNTSEVREPAGLTTLSGLSSVLSVSLLIVFWGILPQVFAVVRAGVAQSMSQVTNHPNQSRMTGVVGPVRTGRRKDG